MPLLKRKAFEKSTASEYLRDDDEVFHCEITDEIFKDYEEYCERIILVNSMVWTCEMTGKNNLTYAEALESEKAARRQLKDFPTELRIPILFLATKTKRSSFAEMSEDLFNYVRERYFVGEAVEACLEGDHWAEAHVLSVTEQKQLPGSTAIPPASIYCYEVEQFENDSNSGGQIGSAPHDRVRRRKGVYTRDKNRLFLKQFVQQGPGGLICIKNIALQKYNINKVNFEQIFTGKPPEFASSKKLLKPSPPSTKSLNKPGSATKLNKSAKKPSPDKKGRQESMDKFVKKTDKNEPGKPKTIDPAAKKNAQDLAERMRKAEELLRQKKEDEKAKKKEKHAKLQAYLKEWQKVKDDLELEDQKIIPKGTTIEVEDIPQSNFGDFLSVLEFVHNFSDILKVKDVFHSGLDLETLRKALTIEEHAGLLCDLVQMFLSTIFVLQEDEAEEYNEDGIIQEFTSDENEVNSDMVELATKASKWSQTYLGTPLSKLPLDPTTVTEVLRLHLLSSGCWGGARGAAWRYQQRGGYSSHDDAALQLRRRSPQLIAALHSTHLASLSLDNKLEILQCLMNQLLSYAAFRDVIEEKLEDFKNKKHTLRTMQINERKREMQLIASRSELKKEAAAKKEEKKLTGEAAKAVDEEMKVKIEKLNKESEDKKKDYEKKVKQLQEELFDFATYLGSDRAFRRYYVGRRIPGLFVEAGAESRGPCRDKPLALLPRPDDILAYVTGLFEQQAEKGSSDKENDSAANSRGNTPKKPLSNVNGLNKSGIELGTDEHALYSMCTGDISSCFVHGKVGRPLWSVYHTEEQIESLIQSLNKRGLRESELRQNLEQDKTNLVDYVKKCPLHLFNPLVEKPPPANVHWTRRKVQPSLKVDDGNSVTDTLELLLRDHIIEIEEKIFLGCLGAIKVKDREAWRGTIMVRGYDKQVESLRWGPKQQYTDKPNGITDPEVKPIINKYRDPGHYLESNKINGINRESDVKPNIDTLKMNGIKVEVEEKVSSDVALVNGVKSEDESSTLKTVRDLASALLQVEQAIHHKYLKRPLGLDDKERKEREAKNKPLDLDALDRWEVSLMESRSFAQVVLHLLTLDSSITWSASILNASCKLCRRKTDPDNMLLCDGCNKGHHLYCLKPKLTKVPEGDWFCEQCKPKPVKERTPRKKRKLFSDDDVDDDSDRSDSELDAVAGAVCGACGSGGVLGARCVRCGAALHAECGPGRRPMCAACSQPQHRASSRRCAAAAIDNIHQFTRALDSRRNSSDSEDSEYNTVLVKLKKSKKTRGSKEASPVNGQRKTSRRSKENVNTSTRKSNNNSLTNGHGEDRSSRRKRNAVKLHVEAIEQLLKEVLKHKDSWPFYEPVNVEDVPDYFDIIDEPMDFSTIKSNLDDGKYSTDDEVMSDMALIFSNCYTYNLDSHPVAKAGIRLEKYIQRRCSELELPSLPETEAPTEEDQESTNKRRKSSEDPEGPKTKKAKLK